MLNRISGLMIGNAALMMAGIRFSAPDDLSSLSLAEMAEMQTDDIKAIKNLLFPLGTYDVRVKSAMLGESRPAPGEVDERTGKLKLPLFFTDFKFEILAARPVDLDLDPESLVGREISERHTFWPNEFKERIGLLKGRYNEVGFDTSGHMGGVEGNEPGWIDSAVEQFMEIRVRHGKPNADGNQKQYFDWKKIPEQEEV